MHLESFALENLGPIKKVEMNLDPHFNVIAGVNGAGKSTILRAIGIMLGRYSSAVRFGRATGGFDRDNIRKGSSKAVAIATVKTAMEAESSSVSWQAGVARPGQRLMGLTRSRHILAFASQIAQGIESEPDEASLPFAVFYSVNRAVLEVPLRIHGKVGFDQYVALVGALSQGTSSFRTFFSWFRDREDVENEQLAEGKRKRDPQLSAVRGAISSMLPGFNNLRVRRQPLRMIVTKNDVDLKIDELSDGEKCLLAMVGDLARRLALANPGMKNPLNGAAIVLIDELELHLHPAWQRNAVTQLKATFPNCQFIVTSHSPQILGEVEAENIVLLVDGKMVKPNRSFGRDTNLVLEELMSATARPVLVANALANLYDLIEDRELDAATAELRTLENKLGTGDPGLTAARSILGVG